MNNNRIGICFFLSLAALLTSCVDEIGHVEVTNKINTDQIVFGGATVNDVIITRSGSAPTTSITEKVLRSDAADVSLPLCVKVEQGINTSDPATRASITTTIDEINQLDAWGTKNTYTDASKTQVTKRELFFYGSDGKAETGALFTKEAGSEDLNRDGEIDDIFYPDGNGPYLWEKNASAVSDFNFVTVSPAGSGFKAVINPANYTVTFDYDVPASAAAQKDILVAVPDPVNVDYGSPVPLDYKHVMAAVNIRIGEKMPAGIIKSIQFKGVYDKASYYPLTNEWTNRSVKQNGGVFNVTLPEGGLPVGPGSIGEDITNEETSFMMIPQQLFTGAELVVEFHDNNSGKDVTLRASIQGDVWEMNTTTNYIISINSNYNLSIVPQDNILDSHYIMTRVEVSSEYPNWSVNVVADDQAEVTVQKESELNSLARDGFWTDKKVTKNSAGDYVIDYNSTEECRGGPSTGGSTSTEMLVVFIPENITGKTRTITITLDGYKDGSYIPETSKTVELKQNPVKWLDPTGEGNRDSYWGCELLIEGGPIKWGFCWDNTTATFILKQGGSSYNPDTDEYGKGQIPKGQDKKIKPAMELAGIDVDRMMTDANYYIRLAEGGTKSEYYIRIDLSKIGSLGVAEELDNGWKNTYDVYHFEGISSLKQLIDFCNSWGDITNPDGRATKIQEGLDYAVMYAMKRNRFYFYEELIPEVGNTMTVPVIFDKDINWYLPARDQFPILIQSNWGQQFSWNDLFWSSTVAATSATDNAHAYAYLNGIETIAHRNDPYLTFALRRYTTSSDVQIPINPGDVIKPGEDNGPGYGEGGNTGGNTGGDIEGNN